MIRSHDSCADRCLLWISRRSDLTRRLLIDRAMDFNVCASIAQMPSARPRKMEEKLREINSGNSFREIRSLYIYIYIYIWKCGIYFSFFRDVRNEFLFCIVLFRFVKNDPVLSFRNCGILELKSARFARAGARVGICWNIYLHFTILLVLLRLHLDDEWFSTCVTRVRNILRRSSGKFVIKFHSHVRAVAFDISRFVSPLSIGAITNKYVVRVCT